MSDASHIASDEAARGPASFWQGLDQMMDRISERLNPILVKEARQAMKSKQFVITFTLLLVCGWGWSFLGVALLSPGIYFMPAGRFMLLGYYFILAFPLIVIVPFSAFRSLASEREDGTFELLSISTLQPYQIVLGKLGSSILQIVLYLSILAPCIAFTYLLRGIDIISIALLLFYLTVSSMYLSTMGLLIATISRARHWQAALSVIMILGLILAFGFSSALVGELVDEETAVPSDQPEFWISQAAILTFVASTWTIMILASSSQLTFRSDNRATRLRVAILVQYILFVGWTSWGMMRFGVDDDVLISFSVLAAIHWYVMGLFMTGESSLLTPRVRRKLPQSLLGRVFFTWFFPGPTTGFVLASMSVMTVTLFVLLVQQGSLLSEFFLRLGRVEAAQVAAGIRMDIDATWCGLLLPCYVVIYLGWGRMVIKLLARIVPHSIVLSLLGHLTLIVLGVVIPMVIQFSLMRVLSDADDYTPIQAPNFIWTFVATMEHDMDDFLVLGLPLVPILVASTAAIVFVLNLIHGAREIVPERALVPERVQQDDELLHASPESVLRETKANPWDDRA